MAVWSETATGFAGKITATGGPKDGNGGYVEISADPGTHGVLDFIGSASLTAAKGTTGTLLLDPYNITISTGTDAGGSFSGGNPNNWNPTATSVINNVTLENQLAISNVIISTGFSGSPGTDAGNLVVSAPVAWSANSNLTLDAFNNLSIGAPISTTGAGSLTLLALNGVTNILSPVSTTTGAIALTGATGIGLSANVRTSGGGITLFDAVTLGANATINSGAGTTTFVSTVDGDHTLTVSSGAVGFDGNIGSVTPLAGLTVTGSTSLFGNVTTDNGAITFNSPVTLDRNVTLNAGTGTIKFASAVDSGPTGFSSPCGAGCDLTVSGGAVTLGGNVGSAVPLGSLSVTGPTTLAGNVTTNNGDISFNSSLQLQGSVTVNSGSGATVAFDGTVDSAPAFPSSGLTVTTGDMFTGGAFGGTNPLGVVSLTAVDGLSLPSIAATGDITLNNPAFLNGNITTSGGNIHFLDTVESRIECHPERSQRHGDLWKHCRFRSLRLVQRHLRSYGQRERNQLRRRVGRFVRIGRRLVDFDGCHDPAVDRRDVDPCAHDRSRCKSDSGGGGDSGGVPDHSEVERGPGGDQRRHRFVRERHPRRRRGHHRIVRGFGHRRGSRRDIDGRRGRHDEFRKLRALGFGLGA